MPFVHRIPVDICSLTTCISEGFFLTLKDEKDSRPAIRVINLIYGVLFVGNGFSVP